MSDWVNMLMYIINGASFIEKKKLNLMIFTELKSQDFSLKGT